jgi:hypothetical protein
MSAARVVDGSRASSCWCVRYADQERNFRTKQKALAFLRQQTKDTRIRPVITKRGPGAYTYYGPGSSTNVMKAEIDRLSFASLRARSHPSLFGDGGGADVE